MGPDPDQLCESYDKILVRTMPAREQTLNPKSGLYVTATPIGNLQDITLRALDILKSVDLILCEDTRVSAKLARHYGLSTPLKACHEHNAERMRPDIIRQIAEGAAIALISDAGTPLISDPGYKLVRGVQEAGLPVITIPGPSALTAALSISGIATDRVFFAGFLPNRKAARRNALQDLKAIDATLVFYESPARLTKSLADMLDILGNREAAIARELTKRFEEVRRAPVSSLIDYYSGPKPPKGEIVILIDRERTTSPPDHDLDALLSDAFHAQSLRDAVDEVATMTGLPRKEIYTRALMLKEKGE